MQRPPVGVALGLLLLGCSGLPTRLFHRPVPEGPSGLTLDALTFDNPAYRTLFDALADVDDDRTAGGPRVPLDRADNAVRARWCSSQVTEEACKGESIGPDVPDGAVWAEV